LLPGAGEQAVNAGLADFPAVGADDDEGSMINSV